jgi:hypothetical protein
MLSARNLDDAFFELAWVQVGDKRKTKSDSKSEFFAVIKAAHIQTKTQAFLTKIQLTCLYTFRFHYWQAVEVSAD